VRFPFVVLALVVMSVRAPLAAAQPPIDAAEAAGDAALKLEQFPAGGWSFKGFWEEHRWHILTVFAAGQVQRYYRNQFGTAESPLFLDIPPSLDVSVRDAWTSEEPPHTFVSAHKTNIFRAISIGTIFAVNRTDWASAGDDAMGLLEALKFNTATTSLVKMVAGRKRPALDAADPNVIGQQAYDDIQARKGGHVSFYSEATSQAFTFASYLDLMAARRLKDRPVARAFSAAGFYSLATAIGYTRIREGQHYLSDVLAGAGAGFFVGRGFYHANHREPKNAVEQKRHDSRIHLTPPMPAPGGGLAVWASIEL
jgi:hypothetical protein